MKANQILNVLNQIKDSNYQSILINGSWGIGKTKYIKDFQEGHTDSCYISLFGKKDIDSIIQELYFSIIEGTPGGKFKKYLNSAREKMGNLDVSYAGLSLSLPLMANIEKALTKELGEKETYIIIFDDLERKHNDLGIEELFGLIDSLSKISNVKTVLVAATEKLNEQNEELFNEYKEKAIGRIYTIDHYSEDAPENILGDQVWKVLRKLVDTLEFKNLRTFEKTKTFITEVMNVLGKDIFTDKFTKDDLYRMCFATVFYNVEHKSEMRLLPNEGDNVRDKLRNATYTSGNEGTITYLCDYVLKNSLDNNMSKLVFQNIKNWFDKGTYYKEDILNIIHSINSYEPESINFYSTERDLLEAIDYTKEYINSLEKDDKLVNIIPKLLSALEWAEILDIDFGISDEQIISLIKDNISKSIDLQKSLHLNKLSAMHFNTRVESKRGKQLIILVNELIQIEYYHQLINEISCQFTNNLYSDYYYLRELKDSIGLIHEQEIREFILTALEKNSFFFPSPSGKITEELWYWCHFIKSLIQEIRERWNLEDVYEKFKTHNYNLASVQEDKMLKHRLNVLFNG